MWRRPKAPTTSSPGAESGWIRLPDGIALTFLAVAMVTTVAAFAVRAALLSGPDAAAIRIIDDAFEHSRKASALMLESVAAADADARQQFEREMHAMSGEVGALLGELPFLQDHVQRITDGAALVTARAKAVWENEDVSARLAALSNFRVSLGSLHGELSGLHKITFGHLVRVFRFWNIILGSSLGLVVLLFLFLSVRYGRGARRRRERRRAVAQMAQSVAAEVDSIGESRPSGAMPDIEFLRPIALAVERARQKTEVLQTRAHASQRWAEFTSDLDALLDMADSETGVLDVVQRAVTFTFGEVDMQVMLADNSFSHLVRRVADGPELCNPTAPQDCPAVRRNVTEENGAEPRLSRCPRLCATDRHITCTFLSVNGRNCGILQLAGSRPLGSDGALLRHLATAAGNRLSTIRILEERELQASTDPLTGLANRRQMNRRLEELDSRRQRYAVVSCDLDHFKVLNDTYGHEVGDRCLRIFAQVLKECSRGSDLPCRPGGEEFLVVLPDADVETAAQVGERIRRSTEQQSRKASIPFTVSVGVADSPSHGHDVETVLRSADEALYAAKGSGRNRVCGPGSPTAVPEVSEAEAPVVALDILQTEDGRGASEPAVQAPAT